MTRVHYKRHEDDEIIDAISFEIVPRYKTSHLSGDEWRISTVVKLKRKGTVMVERSYHTMRAAAAHLPWLFGTWIEELEKAGSDNWSRQIKSDQGLCHQPGCSEDAVSTHLLKREYSREGFSRETNGDVRRAFCRAHLRRGDCELDDADSNYEVVEHYETVEES